MITILLKKIVALLTSISQKSFGSPYWVDTPTKIGTDYDGKDVYLYVLHKLVTSNADRFNFVTTDYTLPNGYDFLKCDLSNSSLYYYLDNNNTFVRTNLVRPKTTSTNTCVRSSKETPNKFSIEVNNTVQFCWGYDIYIYMKKSEVTP